MKAGFSKYYNLFVEGVGFIGKIEDFKEPDVKSKKGESPMGYKVDIGIPEAMEAEVTLHSINKVLFDSMQKMDEAKIVIKEVVLENGKNITINHTMTGPMEFEADTTKVAEGKKVKVKLYPQRYTREQDGEEVAFVDVTVPIFRLNGTDIVEEVRNAVS